MALCAAALMGAPHDSSTDPLPNAERAVVAMNAFSTGPWVRGDWAMQCYLITGHGGSRVRVPLEIIGGWRPDTGRWQRVKLPNGKQWLIKDMMVTDRVRWVIPASSRSDDSVPLGVALLSEPSAPTSPKPAVAPVPAPKQEKKEAIYQMVSAKSDATPPQQKSPSIKTAKPQEGGIALTRVSDVTQEMAPNTQESPHKEKDDKALELAYNGKKIDKGGVSMQTDEKPPVPEKENVSHVVITEPSQSQSGTPATRASVGVWEIDLDGKTHLLGPDELKQGVTERVPLSWELYTMNFLNLPNVGYKGVEKVRARWCDTVELSGPIESGSYTKALVWLDTEFGAPLEAELYNAQGALEKTVRAVSIQRVRMDDENEWILKEWDVLDELTHNKVVIDVSAISMNRNWGSDLYDEKSAKSAWPLIPDSDWKDIE
jgi:hypothetical protein